jgi:two-component system, OmpR family, alkaline phosphatase synthesis response regulator PhoP
VSDCRKGEEDVHKILIVDDDPLIRNLLDQIFEPFAERGVQILSAENGVAAIEIIRKERPDIVFLDVMMPKMNGFQVCNIVKNEMGISGIHVSMLTAKGQEVDRHKADRAGADSYITKPFNISELLARVESLLGFKPHGK